MMISVTVKAVRHRAAGLLRGGLAGGAMACMAWSTAFAQAPLPSPNPLGIWRGTSLCQVRPSPCHDEIVVYRITPVKPPDSLSMDARKIVNGQEEDMGAFGCRFARSSGALTCGMPNGVWRFTIRGDSLVGDLRLPDNTKYRDVRTARSRN
jgi:hypothetical protein